MAKLENEKIEFKNYLPRDFFGGRHSLFSKNRRYGSSDEQAYRGKGTFMYDNFSKKNQSLLFVELIYFLRNKSA